MGTDVGGLADEVLGVLDAANVPADSLMYLQTKYNMQTARKDSSLLDMLKDIRKIAAVF